MYDRLLDGTAHPQSWEEYERLVMGNAEDPDTVIGFRPGAWGLYLKQFLSGADETYGVHPDDDSAYMTMAD